MLHSQRTIWRVSLLPLCVAEEFIGIAVGTRYSKRTMPINLQNSGPNSIPFLGWAGHADHERCIRLPLVLFQTAVRLDRIVASFAYEVELRAPGGFIAVGTISWNWARKQRIGTPQFQAKRVRLEQTP